MPIEELLIPDNAVKQSRKTAICPLHPVNPRRIKAVAGIQNEIEFRTFLMAVTLK